MTCQNALDSWRAAKACLQQAKATYTHTEKVVRDPNAPKKINPWMVHIAQFKTVNPQWSETMTYKEVLEHCKTFYANGVATKAYELAENPHIGKKIQ